MEASSAECSSASSAIQDLYGTPTTESFGTIDEAVRALVGTPLPAGDASATEVNAFLHLLQKAANARGEGGGPRVYPYEIAFEDDESRGRSDGSEGTSKAESEGTSKAESARNKERKRELDLQFGTVNNFSARYRAGQTTLGLVASPQQVVFEKSYAGQATKHLSPTDPIRVEARQKHLNGEADWHSQAIRIRERKMHVYDPSYPFFNSDRPKGGSGQRLELKDFFFSHRLREVVRALFEGGYGGKKFKLDNLYVGGGGNYTGECRVMAFAWLRDIVLRWLRGDAPDRDLEGTEWEELRKTSGLGKKG